MNKLFNNKLLNIVLVFVLVYIIYLLREAWLPIYFKIIKAFTPFILAFAIAFVLYPILKWLVKKNIKIWIKVFIIAVTAFFPIYGLINILPDFISREALLVPSVLCKYLYDTHI